MLLLWCYLALSPQAGVLEDRTDVIELNHCYDANGSHLFDQMIFWDWWPEYSQHFVRAWRIHKQQFDVSVSPVSVMWSDGDRLRRVRATSWRETWTQYDPEVDDRKRWAQERRVGLTAEKKCQKR